MNTSNIKNVTSSWSSGNDIYHAISENIITPIILVIVLVLYIASIVTLSVRIKNRRRKLKQLKNLITSRMSFEKEEKLKWEMYNENTFLVKEIYLLAISICEISYILLPSVTNSIPTLLEKISLITSVGDVGVIQKIPNEIRCRYYNFFIVMTEKGIQSLLLHCNILLVAVLIHYLTGRYLLRETNKQLSLIGYGVIASLIIMLFYNKYTYHCTIIVDLIILVDWFILIRSGRKLSLVLIGRVREMQQCYGNGRIYQNEYNNYLAFRVFHICISSGIVLLNLGMFLRSATTMIFMSSFACNIQGVVIHFHRTEGIEVTVRIISIITKLITPVGCIVFFTPALVYSSAVITRFCVARCKKKKNFQNEVIRPLIDRYHGHIMQ